MDINNLFENLSEEVFWEIINNENNKLRLYNREWQEYSELCSEALKNKKVQSILEEKIPIELSKKDTEDLIKYHSANVEREVIEDKAIFKAGFRYGYYFLKKMELIKEDESDLSA